MTEEARQPAPEADAIVIALRELIAALDRRVPHHERPGEARLAREAAALRQAAEIRIVELIAGGSCSRTPGADCPGPVTDDQDGPSFPA